MSSLFFFNILILKYWRGHEHACKRRVFETFACMFELHFQSSAGNLKGREPAQKREGWRRRPTYKEGGARSINYFLFSTYFLNNISISK